MSNKLWSISLLVLCLLSFLVLCAATAIIDPFFHYHAPLETLEYPLDNQRYQNDGIIKHFSYDSLITGTSMTENFKTTELDALFGVNSIKVNFSGGSFSEICAHIQQAIQSNPELKMVVFAIDEWFLFADGSLVLADGAYPTYLYDSNPWNDVEYLLNKQVLCEDTVGVLAHTRRGNQTTTFDEYASWADLPCGTDYVLKSYNRPAQTKIISGISDQEIRQMEKTFRETILRFANENPQIQFYLYFPPYSILDYDNHQRYGILERQLRGHELLTEILLDAENIHLYSFVSDYDTVTNLDNYKDIVHHSAQINSLILQRMKNGEYQLTRENYQQYWQEVRSFYTNYDYDAVLHTP